MSLMLLVGAALLAKSFRTMQTMKLDFDSGHVLTATLSYSRIPWDWKSAILRNRELLDGFKAIPGVASAASGAIPPSAEFSSLYAKEGDPERRECMAGHPSLDYFDALRIPLLSGRLFTEAELDSQDVIVINETAARLTWPGEQAVGKRIQDIGAMRVQASGYTTVAFRTVIGVVGDIPNSGLARKPLPQIYLPPLSRGIMTREGRFLLRTNGNPGAIAQAVRTAVRSYDRRITIRQVATLEETLAPATAGLRFNTLLMTIFAALAFLLAASGVYSLMSYTVALRTREMSIRMAMGAGRSDIILLVLRTGAVMVGIGVALGFGGAFFAGRFLSSLLCQVESRDPVSFAIAAALMACAALVACYIPARRAGSVDIVETLRQE
jgi:putative ABC transport system permease protein